MCKNYRSFAKQLRKILTEASSYYRERVVINQSYLIHFLEKYKKKMIKKKKQTNKIIKSSEAKIVKDEKLIAKDRIAMQKRNDSNKMNNMPHLNNLFNTITTKKIQEQTKGLTIYQGLVDSFRSDLDRISNEIEIHQNMTVKEFRTKLTPSLTDTLVGTKFPTLKEISQHSTNFNTQGYNSDDSDENEE